MRVEWWRHRAWQVSLAAGMLLVLVVHLAAPAAYAAWIGLQLAGTLLAAVVLRRAGAGWWLVIAARVAAAGAAVSWVVRDTPMDINDMGISTSAQYSLYALAGVLLTRRKRAANGLAAAGFEAGAIVLAIAMLVWCFLFQPYVDLPAFQQVQQWMQVLFSLLDLAILAAVLRGPFLSPRGPARLLAAAGGVLLAGNLYYTAAGSAGPGQFLPGGTAHLFVQVWGVLLTAAALHPDAARLGAASAVEDTPLPRPRLLVILLTAMLSPLLPPLSALVLHRPVTVAQVVPATLLAGLCGMLIGRIWLLAGVDRRRAKRLKAALLELEFRAGHDSLTGLANRDLFMERLPDAGAVLLCGLDGFKSINDACGHEVADGVLVELAGRLQAHAGPGDLAARLGGDEFGFLVADGEQVAVALAERLLAAIAEPVVLGGRRIHLTASAGVAAGSALADADLALRTAKQGGRNRVGRYDAALRADQTERGEIAEGLRRALSDGSLHLVYQPVVDTSTGVPAGAEALIRWDRPGRPISPAEFIPVAEQAGLIAAIGEFALRTACREAGRWHREHGIYVTVNVSTHQLRDPDFTDSVLAVLAETGLPASALVLEITESVLIDVDAAERHLPALRAAGIRIAIDDFGTGYSSLAYLHQLPVDILKIDRTFISRLADPPQPRDVEFTRAILDIARTQGLVAVAEGVETEAQAALLAELRCPLSQGYFFARPAAPEAVDALLGQTAAA